MRPERYLLNVEIPWIVLNKSLRKGSQIAYVHGRSMYIDDETQNCLDVVWLIVDPDSKVHDAYMGPTGGRQDPGGLRVGLMNLAIRGCHVNIRMTSCVNLSTVEAETFLETYVNIVDADGLGFAWSGYDIDFVGLTCPEIKYDNLIGERQTPKKCFI